MTWYIVGAVAFILFLFLRLKKAGSQSILSASILSSDGFEYYVNFKHLRPHVKSIEYLRLILSFITKMYSISDESKEDNRAQIRYFLQSISQSPNLEVGLKKFEDKLVILQTIETNSESKQIIATLLYKDIRTRNIITKVPNRWYPNQFFYSILALILSSINFFDDYQKQLLYKALKNLAAEYYSPRDTTSLNASNILPNKAFIEATFSN